jgi:hypothetical protein
MIIDGDVVSLLNYRGMDVGYARYLGSFIRKYCGLFLTFPTPNHR